MVTFRPSGFATSSSDTNFFTSGDYAVSSYSTLWSTRTTPDVEGLNTPVYLQVLDKFNIPVSFIYGTPPGGTLPGIDIKRMPAIDAIRLSLAESITSNQWWDIYEDGEGGVYFQQTYPTPGSVSLDVRFCVPSASKSNFVDLVVVRGYIPPETREVLPFKEVIPRGLGTINPQTVDGEENLFTVSLEHLIGTDVCHSKLAATEVYKSYRDPVQTSAFAGQEVNPFYSVKRGENLIGYVNRIKGMPDNFADTARIKYSFSNSTTWYFEVDFPDFNEVTAPTCAAGFPQGDGIKYFEAKVDYKSPDYSDRYGYPWPLVLKPAGVFFLGNKLNNIISFGTGDTATNFAIVSPVSEFVSMDSGAGWLWNVVGRGEYEIVLYYQPKFSADLWELVLGLVDGNVVVKYADSGDTVVLQSNVNSLTTSSFGGGSTEGIIGVGSGLGYFVRKLIFAMEIDRPCVKVTDPQGEALLRAEELEMESAPIIVRSTPQPVAYAGTDGSGVVDQTTGLADTDPTTVQNFEESDLEKLYDKMQGNVMDVTLPFCGTEDDCLNAAITLYNYMHNVGTDTFVLTCGPDSEPRLGAQVDGYGANLVIDSISYSFNDSSSYTIDVTLGPIFTNIGSWNNGAWVKQTETIERPAIIRWTAGDGVNYRVEVQGLGMYNAVNGTRTVFYNGEVVSVQINNNPVEA